MPIYEYACRACSHAFEVLVRGTIAPACPKCGSADLERLHSSFACTSAEQLKAAVQSGRKKLGETTWREQRAAARELDRNHHH